MSEDVLECPESFVIVSIELFELVFDDVAQFIVLHNIFHR